MKRLWLGVLLAILVACGDTAVQPLPPAPNPDPAPPPGEGEQIQYTLTEILERLAAVGDVSAQAIINSGVADELNESNYPLVLFFTNEGNITFGSYEPDETTESVFERGDKNLLAYLAEQGLTEKEFLNHPKLREFVRSQLILGEVPLGEIGATKNNSATFQSAEGTDIVFTTKENLIPADGPVIYANGIPVDSGSYFDGTDDDLGYLNVADAPIVTDFDWSQ